MRHSSQSITVPIYVSDNVDGGPDARNTAYFNSQMPVANLQSTKTIDSKPLNFTIDGYKQGMLDIAVYSNTTYQLTPAPAQIDQDPLIRAISIVPDVDVAIKSSFVNNPSWYNRQKIVTSSVVFTTYDYNSGLNAEGTIGTLYPAIPETVLNPFIGSISADTKTGELRFDIQHKIAVTGEDLVAPFVVPNVPLNTDGTPAKPGKQVIIR